MQVSGGTYRVNRRLSFAAGRGRAVISYLVTAYYSAAILVPDAVGVLENVALSGPRD